MSLNEIKESLKGQWMSIGKAIGLTDRQLKGLGSPCPICRDGKDRFAFLDGKSNMDSRQWYGGYYCRHCGSGDGIDLIMKMNGVDYMTAAETALNAVGLNIQTYTQTNAREKNKDDLMREKLLDTYKSMIDARGTVAQLYLNNRNLDVPKPFQIDGIQMGAFYSPNVKWYHETMKEMITGALIFKIVRKSNSKDHESVQKKVRMNNNRPVLVNIGLHLIFIGQDEQKIGSQHWISPRYKYNKDSWFIITHLGEDSIILGEGVENVLSVGQAVRKWHNPTQICLGGSSMFANYDPLCLGNSYHHYILTDREPSMAGLIATCEAYRNIKNADTSKNVIPLIPFVEADWNDSWRRRNESDIQSLMKKFKIKI